jgi:hypothetical protein
VFSSKNEFRLFIDISSSSATFALIESTESEYKTLWHHRERFLIIEDTSDVAYFKKIISTIELCFKKLDSDGFKTLPAGKGKAVKTLHVSVGAPWSYTIVRKNTLKRDEPFVVSEKLLKKFENETDDRVLEDLKNGVFELGAGLELKNAETITSAVNGYPVNDIFDKEVRSIELVRLLGLYDKKILNELNELAEKYIPSATLMTETNMQVLYEFISHTLFLEQLTIFDVSGEVIETAVIEAGQLHNVSYIISGLHALVRDMKTETGKESEHILAALKGGLDGLSAQFPDQTEKITAVYNAHINVMTTALKKILTEVSHPEHLFIRTTPGYEALFTNMIESALDAIDDKDYALHVFSPKLLKAAHVTEAKTNVASFVFHNYKRK